MSAYNPPKKNTPIFDSLLFSETDTTTYLTPAVADTKYLKFPTAQGTETFNTINTYQIVPTNNTGINNTNAIGYTFAISLGASKVLNTTSASPLGYYYTYWASNTIPNGTWLVQGNMYVGGTAGSVGTNNYLQLGFSTEDQVGSGTSQILLVAQNAINTSAVSGVNTQVGCPNFTGIVQAPFFQGTGGTPNTINLQAFFYTGVSGGGTWTFSNSSFITFTRIA